MWLFHDVYSFQALSPCKVFKSEFADGIPIGKREVSDMANLFRLTPFVINKLTMIIHAAVFATWSFSR